MNQKTTTSFFFLQNVIYECKGIVLYRKVASFNTSHLETHVGFFRLLMKGIFDPYIMYCDLLKKVDFVISNAR